MIDGSRCSEDEARRCLLVSTIDARIIGDASSEYMRGFATVAGNFYAEVANCYEEVIEAHLAPFFA